MLSLECLFINRLLEEKSGGLAKICTKAGVGKYIAGLPKNNIWKRNFESEEIDAILFDYQNHPEYRNGWMVTDRIASAATGKHFIIIKAMMMTYLSADELKNRGFKKLGSNVKISDKASIYNADQIEIGDNSRVDDFCVISGNVRIGKFVHIAPHCLVAGGEKGVVMNDFSGLAYYVQVFSQSDDYSGQSLTNPTVTDRYKNETKRAVVIGQHVIIGAGSIVFPGVIIAEGCSVGAMTLVNKDTDPWGIYVGNPAKRVKERKRDLLKLEAEFLASLNI